MTKIAIVGAGTRVGQPGFALMEELRHGGLIEGVDYILDPKCAADYESVVIPRSHPTTIPQTSTRNTGAARIKRNAKQRRNRKGK